ncbi:MAG: ABC transporter substrate-binding protein [Prevotella sp.]|nr:ABC transporter substrate-binding protein [Prevotella sp.]
MKKILQNIRKVKFPKIAALAAAALLLAACGKSPAENDVRPASQEYAYKAAGAELAQTPEGDYSDFAYSGGRIYFTSKKYPDGDGEGAECFLNIVGADGGGFTSVRLCSPEDLADASDPVFAPDGTGFYIRTETGEDGSRYFIKSFDENGAETASLDFTEAAEKHFPDGLYVHRFGVDGAGNFYITDYGDILVLARDGSYKGFVSLGNGGVHDFAADKNGGLYAWVWNGSGYELDKLDIPDGVSEEKPKAADIPFEGYSNRFISGNGGDTDFYVYDDTSLYGYSIGEEPRKLLDWVQTGVSVIEVSDVFWAGEDTFVCAGKSFPHEYPKFSMLTKQPVSSGDKTEIVLAGTEYSITSYIKNQIVKFNAANDKYFVTLKEYADDGADKLNLDLTGGKVPDILITNSYTPTETYIAKGIFADLYEFIDSDGELSRGDFVPNLLSSFETDGKLCRFTDSFTVYTVLGKTSVFGGDMGITVERLNEIAAARPEGTELFAGFTKTDILRYAMEMSGNEFIDFKNGSCDFNSESFVKMLEFANGYVNDIDFDSYFDDSFWSRFDTMFSDESVLLMAAYLMDYSDIYRFERCNFGETVTALGFPCKDRIGTSFVVDSGFSIAEKSPNKEGAWEFVRTLLLPEYQDCADKFPVRKDSLEKYAAAAMKYDPDRINQAVVMMGGMAVSSGVHEIGEPKREDIDRMNEVIASADGIMSYNESVLEIITEEASTYFSGSKSAEDAAALIQTRVRLYLDENA